MAFDTQAEPAPAWSHGLIASGSSGWPAATNSAPPRHETIWKHQADQRPPRCLGQHFFPFLEPSPGLGTEDANRHHYRPQDGGAGFET